MFIHPGGELICGQRHRRCFEQRSNACLFLHELIGLRTRESLASVGLIRNEKRVGQHVVNPSGHRRIRSAVGLVAL